MKTVMTFGQFANEVCHTLRGYGWENVLGQPYTVERLDAIKAWYDAGASVEETAMRLHTGDFSPEPKPVIKLGALSTAHEAALLESFLNDGLRVGVHCNGNELWIDQTEAEAPYGGSVLEPLIDVIEAAAKLRKKLDEHAGH